MAEYKGNSNRSREEKTSPAPIRRVTEPVVSGAKKQKKKGLSRFLEFFHSEEVTETRQIIATGISAVQRLLDAMDVIMGVSRGGNRAPAARVGYRKYYDDRDDRSESNRGRANAEFSYQDIVFETRGDAEAVLWRMEEMLDTFQNVSIGDMYDLSGITGGSYTDFKYGWTDLRGARVERVSDGYIIDLPRATNL